MLPSPPIHDMRQTYARLLRHVGKQWWVAVIALVATMVGSGIDASMIHILQPLLDRGFIAKDQSFLLFFPFLIVTIFIFRGSFGLISGYCLNYTSKTVVMKLRQHLVNKMLHLPKNTLSEYRSGQLLSKVMYDAEQVARACSDALMMLVRESVFVVGCVVIMFIQSPRLAILFFIAAPLVAYLVRMTNRRLRKLSYAIQHAMGNITQITEELIKGMWVVRMFQGQSYEYGKFMSATKYHRHLEMKLVIADSLSGSMVQSIVALVLSGAVLMVTLDSQHVMITAGGFAAFITATVMMLKPLKNLTMVNNIIQKGLTGAHAIFEFLDLPEEEDFGVVVLSDVKGDIHFDHVYFRYHEDAPWVLQDFSLKVSAGETIALVGRSGGGKSTLIQLLARFYKPTEGRITIDNNDVSLCSLSSLRDQFSLVSQDILLFNDSIRKNIAYGEDEVDEQRMFEAAKMAHALEFIEHLPKRFETLIGDNGAVLSGGQRQRIAIARAMYKKSPILILDEATSSLDNESEYLIQQALSHMMHQRTLLIVAHRLSTIEKADRIVVLDRGCVVEVGDHLSLLKKQGFYAQLYQQQFQG